MGLNFSNQNKVISEGCSKNRLKTTSKLLTWLEDNIKAGKGDWEEDGRGIRWGDHHSPHKHTRNSSRYGSAVTKQPLGDSKGKQAKLPGMREERGWRWKKGREGEPERSLCPVAGREFWRRRSSHALGGSLTGRVKGELRNLGKLGTSGQKTEKVALSQPIKSSQTVVPTRWQARGMERRPHKSHSTERGPRGPGESRHTNLCSHNPQGAEPGPQELKELKNPMT